jgi:hypothetical protein
MTATTPADIRAARLAAGLTQSAAAALCYRSRRGWQDCERGLRQLDPAAWALFLIRSRKLAKKRRLSPQPANANGPAVLMSKTELVRD